jgi:hypothetical protein
MSATLLDTPDLRPLPPPPSGPAPADARPAPNPTEAPRCRHCGRQRSTVRGRGRGLCWMCWHKPGVRQRHPRRSPRGVGEGCRGYRLPDRPTPAPPGSPGKVAVLEERARLGVALWHPLDATE